MATYALGTQLGYAQHQAFSHLKSLSLGLTFSGTGMENTSPLRTLSTGLPSTRISVTWW
jgi:hypothetical protein